MSILFNLIHSSVASYYASVSALYEYTGCIESLIFNMH